MPGEVDRRGVPLEGGWWKSEGETRTIKDEEEKVTPRSIITFVGNLLKGFHRKTENGRARVERRKKKKDSI